MTEKNKYPQQNNNELPGLEDNPSSYHLNFEDLTPRENEAASVNDGAGSGDLPSSREPDDMFLPSMPDLTRYQNIPTETTPPYYKQTEPSSQHAPVKPMPPEMCSPPPYIICE